MDRKVGVFIVVPPVLLHWFGYSYVPQLDLCTRAEDKDAVKGQRASFLMRALVILRAKAWPGPACLKLSSSSHLAWCAGMWWPTLGGSGWPFCCCLCGLAVAGRYWRFPLSGIRWTTRGPWWAEWWTLNTRLLSHVGSTCWKNLQLTAGPTLTANCWAKTSLPVLYVCVRPVSASFTITRRERPDNTSEKSHD